MTCKIIGAKREMGNYQGRDYDNIKLRVTQTAVGRTVEDGLEFGDRVYELKAKSTILSLEKAYEYYTSGVLVEIYFDQFKNPVLFNPVKK